MTLFKTIIGRMAIHRKLLAIYDIMSVSEKNELAHSASGEWRS